MKASMYGVPISPPLWDRLQSVPAAYGSVITSILPSRIARKNVR